MMNLKNLSLVALLAAGGFALAQECETPCDKSECDKSAGDSNCEIECCDPAECRTALLDARKELQTYKSDLSNLSKVERTALADAEKSTLGMSAAGKALAPSFGAAADLLYAAAKLRAENQEESALLSELSTSYRLLARELNGGKGYTAPAADDAKALEKAHAAQVKATKLWQEAQKEELSTETAQAWRLVKSGSPLYRTLAINQNAIANAMKALDCSDESAACTGAILAVSKLNALVAPSFDGVDMSKPADTPAPT